MDLVEKGKSIEGLRLEGSSRNPLRYKGAELVNGRKCHKFLATFNTKSSIIEKLGKDVRKIVGDAITDLDCTVLCDDAVIRSLEKKHSTAPKSNASSTHGTNAWLFSNQTNVLITRSHKEIENAIFKRKQIEAQKKEKLLK